VSIAPGDLLVRDAAPYTLTTAATYLGINIWTLRRLLANRRIACFAHNAAGGERFTYTFTQEMLDDYLHSIKRDPDPGTPTRLSSTSRTAGGHLAPTPRGNGRRPWLRATTRQQQDRSRTSIDAALDEAMRIRAGGAP